MKRAIASGAALAVVVAAWWLSQPDERPPSAVGSEAAAEHVWASSGALADLARRVMGEGLPARTVGMVGGLPVRDDLVAMQRARVVLALGPACGDGWLDLVGLPAGVRVELASGAWGETLVAQTGAIVHRHGPAGAHTHVERESSPWVEPRRARELIDLLELELERRGLAPRARSQSARALALELERLAARLDAVAVADLLASHGAFRHLATRAGWSVEIAAVDLGEPPNEGMKAALAAARGRRPAARIIVVPKPPHADWIPLLAGLELECAVVPIDGDGRYFDALGGALESLASRLASR